MKVMKVESDEQLRDAFKVRTKVFVHEQGVPNELEIDEQENDSTHFVMYHEMSLSALEDSGSLKEKEK